MLSRPAVASSATGQSAVFGKTNVSGPGQNASASFAASALKRASAFAAARIGYMRDKRVKRGPALGVVKPRNGAGIGRVGAEAVHRLGRKGDEAASLKAMHGIADGCGIGPRYARGQGTAVSPWVLPFMARHK